VWVRANEFAEKKIDSSGSEVKRLGILVLVPKAKAKGKIKKRSGDLGLDWRGVEAKGAAPKVEGKEREN
jgi:hypothetical protein